MINNKWGLRRDMGLHSNRYLFRSQCFYRTDSRSFDGWDETGDGAGDDDGDGGCDASADAHGRVDKHGSLEETGVHGGMTYRGIHDFIGGYATHHADVSEDTGDDDALGDDELQYRPRFGIWMLSMYRFQSQMVRSSSGAARWLLLMRAR